jgi:hypothetical protein
MRLKLPRVRRPNSLFMLAIVAFAGVSLAFLTVELQCSRPVPKDRPPVEALNR